jgi:hypothetical protein
MAFFGHEPVFVVFFGFEVVKLRREEERLAERI